MKTFIDCYQNCLCVVIEEPNQEQPDSEIRRCWYPARQTAPRRRRVIIGRPVTQVNLLEGTYVDEEGSVYQLADKGETKPIAVERIPKREKSELEVLLEASLKNGKEHKPNGDLKPRRRFRNSERKALHALRTASAPRESASPKVAATETGDATVNGEVAEPPLRLNLRQKLAEVRLRIGYVQKRGHNEIGNYSYVTAADIAGAVGDLLAELGVVVIPKLETIAYETTAGRGEPIRMARVVMAYTFVDVDSGEELVAKVAGQGLDPGDKAPYKAMTGALKYALLQSFLLATGDDPEDDRLDARSVTANSERPINEEELRTLKTLIDETGTELERVLAYYKLASLEEMTEGTYRRAMEVLNRKLAQRTNQETAHAQS